jgi:hypothetical protein
MRLLRTYKKANTSHKVVLSIFKRFSYLIPLAIQKPKRRLCSIRWKLKGEFSKLFTFFAEAFYFVQYIHKENDKKAIEFVCNAISSTKENITHMFPMFAYYLYEEIKAKERHAQKAEVFKYNRRRNRYFSRINRGDRRRLYTKFKLLDLEHNSGVVIVDKVLSKYFKYLSDFINDMHKQDEEIHGIMEECAAKNDVSVPFAYFALGSVWLGIKLIDTEYPFRIQDIHMLDIDLSEKAQYNISRALKSQKEPFIYAVTPWVILFTMMAPDYFTFHFANCIIDTKEETLLCLFEMAKKEKIIEDIVSIIQHDKLIDENILSEIEKYHDEFKEHRDYYHKLIETLVEEPEYEDLIKNPIITEDKKKRIN